MNMIASLPDLSVPEGDRCWTRVVSIQFDLGGCFGVFSKYQGLMHVASY
jgi:hypothetical protein